MYRSSGYARPRPHIRMCGQNLLHEGRAASGGKPTTNIKDVPHLPWSTSGHSLRILSSSNDRMISSIIRDHSAMLNTNRDQLHRRSLALLKMGERFVPLPQLVETVAGREMHVGSNDSGKITTADHFAHASQVGVRVVSVMPQSGQQQVCRSIVRARFPARWQSATASASLPSSIRFCARKQSGSGPSP